MALYKYINNSQKKYNLSDLNIFNDQNKNQDKVLTEPISSKPFTQSKSISPVHRLDQKKTAAKKSARIINFNLKIISKKIFIFFSADKINKILLKSTLPKIYFPKKLINFNKFHLNKKSFPSFAPHLMIIMGLGMLLFVFYPIIKWQIIHPLKAPENKIVKPTDNSSESKVLSASVVNKDKLNNAGNWFPSYHPSVEKNKKIKKYTISIPKLKINNAEVIYDSEDLNKSLIGYQGTAIPGEYGNAVIFGHSVLPEFFNPEDYNTIFATLPQLKAGDEIYTNVDGVKYKYVAYDFKTVDPTEISVLEQKYDNYYLSLITCVPPGLKWKRLVVKAKLEPFD